MTDLPGFSFWHSRYPEVALVALVVIAVLAIIWRRAWIARRAERHLRIHELARRGFREANKRGWVK